MIWVEAIEEKTEAKTISELLNQIVRKLQCKPSKILFQPNTKTRSQKRESSHTNVCDLTV